MTLPSQDIKQCCASFYGSDAARLLLGESFHPGGTRLTDRLGRLTHLTGASKVLDVAAGRGTSALYLAETFGCEVIGVDLSADNVRAAAEEAAKRRVTRVIFKTGDAERLPFEPGFFDAVICECAFCTFPDKATAAREFARVLKPGGRLGLSDLTRTEAPLAGLEGLLSWIACIGDARPEHTYIEILQAAGLVTQCTEDHSRDLTDLVRTIQGRLLGAELMAALKLLNPAEFSIADAKEFAIEALKAINANQLGYIALAALKQY
jgi:arsenite methyltransferase